MHSLWRRVVAIAALGVCSSAAAADPHLFSDESAVLRTGNVTVLVTDPDPELGVYLKMNTQTNMPPGYGGAIGSGGAAIATDIINAHRANEFVEAMRPYVDAIGKQHFTDQEYALLHDVLGGIPWMQKADWQRMPGSTDRRQLLGMMKKMRSQAALLVTPETLLRDDLDQMLVGYRIELYVKDPYEDYGVKRLRFTEFTRLSPDPAADTFPALDYMHSDVDEATTQHLSAFFADGGTHLSQYFQGALPMLRSQLTYFFTGVMPPAPATTPAVVAATRAVVSHP